MSIGIKIFYINSTSGWPRQFFELFHMDTISIPQYSHWPNSLLKWKLATIYRYISCLHLEIRTSRNETVPWSRKSSVIGRFSWARTWVVAIRRFPVDRLGMWSPVNWRCTTDNSIGMIPRFGSRTFSVPNKYINLIRVYSNWSLATLWKIGTEISTFTLQFSF